MSSKHRSADASANTSKPNQTARAAQAQKRMPAQWHKNTSQQVHKTPTKQAKSKHQFETHEKLKCAPRTLPAVIF
ncbi:hypothetical protein [Paraburkholderia hospita]|uniref:hypothetical protein n=1 Tax=Paraburkholderia hospita TaxID=169430 RepID=UPI001177D7D7|nr:hypothetical protein [Paraburkholderia hospita]